ncbi:MAG: LacI family DNA-binding transcriptional regulator [Anaerolineae bacterium]|nr:LacI family DNA-binding transcriptional regulator [Anaerolineae bacterium]
MRGRRPTQADIARLVGISQSAVSQVLSGIDSAIPEETRQRVLAAADELRYVPNKLARSLRTQKTYTIASVIPDITNPFYPAYQRGIQSVTNEHRYDLIVYDTEERADNEERSLQSLERGGIDGAIVVLFHHDAESLRPLIEQGVHVVMWRGRPTPEEDLILDTIYVDNISLAKTAVSHLIQRGHTRIGMIAGLEGTPPRNNRIRGFCEALAEHDLPMHEVLVQGGDFTETGGYEGMKELLKLTPRPTAVFASNDLMALGALLAVREAGLDVPHDVALIGIDDIPAARLVQPPLTTISQMQENIGRTAAEMVFERIAGTVPPKPRLVEMPFRLIVRESV